MGSGRSRSGVDATVVTDLRGLSIWRKANSDDGTFFQLHVYTCISSNLSGTSNYPGHSFGQFSLF